MTQSSTKWPNMQAMTMESGKVTIWSWFEYPEPCHKIVLNEEYSDSNSINSTAAGCCLSLHTGQSLVYVEFCFASGRYTNRSKKTTKSASWCTQYNQGVCDLCDRGKRRQRRIINLSECEHTGWHCGGQPSCKDSYSLNAMQCARQ